jgi:hypothetical protein
MAALGGALEGVQHTLAAGQRMLGRAAELRGLQEELRKYQATEGLRGAETQVGCRAGLGCVVVCVVLLCLVCVGWGGGWGGGGGQWDADGCG